MMKKLTYLLGILMTVALLSTSCCKDDDLIPDEQLTKSVITGNEWVSVSYNGVACGSCNTGIVTDITLSTEGTGDYDFELLDNCNSSNRWYVNVELNADATELKLTGSGSGTFYFDVLSYEDEILTLRLTFTNISGMPANGTYVLEKL